MPFPTPHPLPGWRGKEEEEGGGLAHFLCLPHTRPSKGSSPTAKTTSLGSTTDLQIATTKKMFLLPDN